MHIPLNPFPSPQTLKQTNKQTATKAVNDFDGYIYC